MIVLGRLVRGWHCLSAATPLGGIARPEIRRDPDSDLDAAGEGARCAGALDERAPAALAGELGVEILVWCEPLSVKGRRLHGAWDPLLRRIELFGCNARRTDDDLMHTFAHEIGHAVLHSKSTAGEAGAETFAQSFLGALGSSRIAAAAAALRRMVRRRAAEPALDRAPTWPLTILP